MTRKDYELIARAFRIANGSIQVAEYDAKTALDLASAILADSLEKTNPRFDRDRFLVACGFLPKCDKCEKRARFSTSRASYCSLPHAPEWVRRVKATA
jgi:hypothetical protein